jgi:hypothetical protein
LFSAVAKMWDALAAERTVKAKQAVRATSASVHEQSDEEEEEAVETEDSSDDDYSDESD